MKAAYFLAGFLLASTMSLQKASAELRTPQSASTDGASLQELSFRGGTYDPPHRGDNGGSSGGSR